MNRLGFTYWEAKHITLGMWHDLFDVFKMQHNFEKSPQGHYNVVPEGNASLDEI